MVKSSTDVTKAYQQIRSGSVKTQWWLSDGGKGVEGRCIGIERCSNGIRLTLHNGKGVTWRMSKLLASQVLTLIGDEDDDLSICAEQSANGYSLQNTGSVLATMDYSLPMGAGRV